MSNYLNINPGLPPTDSPPQNHNGPLGPNLHMPALDLRTTEELCQPTMNGRGGPIAPVNIQATDFRLKNHMIQQVQNICLFHGLPGDDANKHLDKFLTITRSMKQNGVTDDALRLYLFPYSLTHHATAWFDRLPKNSILTFQEMATKFLSKYFPPSMVTKLRNEINTFYNGLTLRHRDTINAAAGGIFMKRRHEECYDLIENMTAHHNDWDISAHRDESSSFTTSSSEIAALAQQMIEMRKDMIQMFRSNHQVNYVTPSYETCGGPHSYYECQAAGGYTQDIYATTGNYNPCGHAYQPQGDRNLPSYHANNFLGPPGFNPPNNQNQGNNQNFQNQNRFNQNQGYNQNRGQNFNQGNNYNQNQGYQNHGQNFNQAQPNVPSLKEITKIANLMGQVQKALQERPQGALPRNTIPNPLEERKAITTWSGIVLAEPLVPLLPLSYSSKESSPSSRSFEIPPPPTSSSELPNRNPHQPLISYPLRLNKGKLQDKSDTQVHKFFQMFKKLHFNISLAEALALMPKYHKMLKDLLSDKEKLLGLANTSLTKNCSTVLLKKLPEKLGDLGKFLIPCDFPELEKCMALANLGASINLIPLSVWKKLMIPELVPTCKFTFPVDFVVVDYDVDPRVPLILGKPFLRMALALVDVYIEELILIDGDEKLIFHADTTSKHPQKHGNELINMINFIDITCEDLFQEVLKIKKSNHPISGSTTSSDSFPSLTPFKTNPSIDSSPATDIDLIDPIIERFTDEPALVYSSPPGDDDDDDDDLLDFNSDNDEWKKLLYGDNFNDIHSGKDKIKDSKIKILIDELESPESNVLLPQLLTSDLTLPEESYESSEIATLFSSPF
ncbi:hypothetical protein Tco_0886430 [Tanacetum coccineum]